MYGQFAVEKKGEDGLDQRLLMVVFLLTGVGAAFLFSASSYFSGAFMRDPYALFIKHIISCLLGVACAIIASRLSMDLIRRLIPLAVIVVALLNLITVFLGFDALGARRWINLFGLSLQPSELIKPVLILYLAHMYDKNASRMDDAKNALLPPFLMVVLMVGLVFLQNDFSTGVILFGLAFAISFIAGVSWKWLLAVVTGFGATAVALLLSKPHRISRIVSWFDPSLDPEGASYQVLASQAALREGGFWGLGLGEGMRKIGGLPEAHSDFVFAVCGEETGFAGILVIILLFGVFSVLGFLVSERQSTVFGRLTAFGVTTSIFYQVLVNMSVVSGLVPATGIPLPFFSSGGTHILITLTMCGLLLNLSRVRGAVE